MSLYPPIEPYDHGLLDVGDGNEIYWEVSGNPAGRPAVVVHGGPGGGTIPVHRQQFDPSAYRIVLFDQRNCGRSRPHARDPEVSLEHNTTWHLVADLEKLREHLGVDRWLLLGGSWGSTLALAYAQTHPERVSAMVLRGIFLLRESEIRWAYTEGVSHLYPDHWARFTGFLPEEERGDLLAAYRRRFDDPDPAVRGPAALAWARWEASISSLIPDSGLIDMFADEDLALAFARIESHYVAARGFMEEGRLLRDLDAIRHIPAVIVQGRYDMCTPPATAWDLHQAWPEARFVLVEGAGHSGAEPAIMNEVVGATDAFVAGSPHEGALSSD
ncbi:prolyl aminopeptidase [Nonomuraea sp. NPDC046570]|uniref:prolyl aminopeptidase n=1 Tax=Nonomuraea sp. NPDC046570 TaxID=3155255 RepID=UPI0033C6156B